MPLTQFQLTIANLIARNRTQDSHLAGGAAIHLNENSNRYSYDLDYFHDSLNRVFEAFSSDKKLLEQNNYDVQTLLNQPGFIQARVSNSNLNESTKVEWAHDSAFRFFPSEPDDNVGYKLHDIDLAINKVLALIGRNEPRDYLDTIFVHNNTLSLGALIWAACGKDPGYSPSMILDFCRRKGVYRDSDFEKLNLVESVNPIELKHVWLNAISHAENFIESRDPKQLGCLYTNEKSMEVYGSISELGDSQSIPSNYKPHYGKLFNVLPEVK